MTTTEVDISKIAELKDFFEQNLKQYIGEEDTPYLQNRIKALLTECLESRGLREPVQTKYLTACIINDMEQVEKIWSDGTTEVVPRYGAWWSLKRKQNLCRKIADSERGIFHLIAQVPAQMTHITVTV